MKVFLGEYRHSLTEGRRLSLPKKIRERITGSEVFLTKGFEEYIAGFDGEQWERMSSGPLSIPLHEKRGRELRRQVFAAAVAVEVDEQGRILLPENLVKAAGVSGDDLVVVGAGDHFEIWNPVLWQEHLAKIDKGVGS